MKILSITPFLRGAPFHPTSGGKSAISLKVTNALLDERHQVFVLPWSKEYIHEETRFLTNGSSKIASGLPTMFIPGPKRLTTRLAKAFINPEAWKNPKHTVWKEFREGIYDKGYFLKRAIKRSKPDIVHAHYTHSDIAQFYRDGGFPNPFVLTHHSKGVSNSIPLYDHVVFISHFQYQQARSIYPDVEDRHSVIHNCVDNAYMGRINPEESNKILYLSNIPHGKGLDILLNSFAQSPDLDKFHLDVIGIGELLTPLKEFVKNHDLRNVTFLGRLSIEENIRRMEDSSLFVVPSRGEGFGVIYMEALCSGLPIIGFPQTVRELNEMLGIEVGYEFDANNESSKKLADIIEKAMSSKLTRLGYRKEMMKRARKLFSYDTFRNKYLNLYQKLAN